MQFRVGFFGLLGILFIGLKLGGVIAWHWALVLLPLYGVPVFIVGSVFVMFLMAVAVELARQAAAKGK